MKQPRLNIDGDPIEPIGLIEIGSMLGGMLTVIGCLYIFAVRFGLIA